MKKANTSTAYFSGIISMFDFSYPDKPIATSKTTADIDKAAKQITEQSFRLTGKAMELAMHQHEK